MHTFQKLELLLKLALLLLTLLLIVAGAGLEFLPQVLSLDSQRLELVEFALDFGGRDVLDIFELVHQVLHIEGLIVLVIGVMVVPLLAVDHLGGGLRLLVPFAGLVLALNLRDNYEWTVIDTLGTGAPPGF